MKRYIGTKEIQAFPQTKEGRNGYAVIYPDGYSSWSPKDVFEAAYRTTEGDGQRLTFGDAIHFMKQGRACARAGWNGKGMWIALTPGNPALPASSFWNENNRAYAAGTPEGAAPVLPSFTMKTATGEILMGWLASQTDMVADDWCVLPLPVREQAEQHVEDPDHAEA